ncbi:MAG: DUF1611 domain-containing protein, partial [Woeseiaceae bacterium]
MGLNIDTGLHDFLSEDKEMVDLAAQHGVTLRDIRKPPPRAQLHFFEGKIEKVDCLKLAVLGTDSAVGKRTTAWVLVHALRAEGLKAELIGTGQTAWLQGARYGVIMDSLVNDFVSGEIEHAVYSAWEQEHPDVIIIDMDSPDRDTLEHMRSISVDRPKPIVMFAEDGDSATIEEAVRAGVSAYVVDGLNPGRVKPIMEVALNGMLKSQWPGTMPINVSGMEP